MSQQAMRCLMAYSWPGNVRQLENAIERAVALSGGRTSDRDGRPHVRHSAGVPDGCCAGRDCFPTAASTSTPTSASIEHELIRRALEKTGGNKGQASKLLNLKRTTLVEKLKRLEPRTE